MSAQRQRGDEGNGEQRTRTCLGRGKLTPNGQSVRTTLPKDGVREDSVLESDSEVVFWKEGPGRIVIESVEQPLPSAVRNLRG